MVISLAAGLDTALRTAGIPIAGVSIGTPADRGTWTVQFLPEATGPQRTQAAGIVAVFDPADLAVIATQLESEAGLQFDTDRLLKAKALSDLAFRLGKAPAALTVGEIASERTRIINIYKAIP